MPDSLLIGDELKRKIRRLKKLELKIRFGNADNHSGLVWDTFFNLGGHNIDQVRYTFDSLSAMDREKLKSVIDEFFLNVYYRFYKENGITSVPVYDPVILAELELPPDSDYTAIKQKFRELAMKYHPDVGGDAEKFIKLMENYKKLTGGG